MPNLIVYPDHDTFSQGAADFIAEQAAAAIAQSDRFTVALAGGGTPQPVYARLATVGYRERIDWTKVQVCFSDERCVPPDDERSNYRMAREALLDHVPLPAANIHRIQGEIDPAQAAINYEHELQRLFHPAALPTFDLICLGLGQDGHTASLFPGTAALREPARWVVAHYITALSAWRVTFTARLINDAHWVAFLVEGAGKADVLQRVLYDEYQPEALPAQLIQPASGQLHWLVDAAAAARLPHAGAQ